MADQACFFVDGTPTAEIYTLSLHDALPISRAGRAARPADPTRPDALRLPAPARLQRRSEEHTSELQSRENLVCRLLLEKKKDRRPFHHNRNQQTTIMTRATIPDTATCTVLP